MSQRERGRQVTVVERMTTTGDPSSFERALVGYARHRESAKGFEALVTAACPEHPGSYVHLDQWSTLDRLLQASHEAGHEDGPSPVRHPGLGPGTTSTSELMVTVGRMTVGGELSDAAHVVLVRAVLDGPPKQFELDFGALVAQCVSDSGFGGSDLLRSAADPRVYLGVLWWLDAEACARVRAGDGYRNRLAGLSAAAEVSEEPTRVLRVA
ncbi:hypothetical protein ACFVX6_12605 [Streptomyces sp. NPDC058289]|uniref:hypothetical protein n=1 Tax=Streptomyces sp. NPDC058289 TaxID=3346425 RepID=UPI0036EC4458